MRGTAAKPVDRDTRTGRGPSLQIAGGSVWATALVVGLAAFVAGASLTGAIFYLDTASGSSSNLHGATMTAATSWDGGSEPGMLRTMNWVYFNAQFVGLEVSAGISQTLDYLALTTSFRTVPSTVYTLVPIVVLVAAGGFVARTTVGRDSSLVIGAAAGATTSLGYLLAVLVAVQFAAWSPGGFVGAGSIEVPLVEAALIAGIGFPVVFGAIGGALGTRG